MTKAQRIEMNADSTLGDPPKDQRLQIDFAPDRVEELKNLMRECNFKTYRELFNSSLAMFEWAVKERRMGRAIASIDEATMKYKELNMPGLQAVRVNRQMVEIG